MFKRRVERTGTYSGCGKAVLGPSGGGRPSRSVFCAFRGRKSLFFASPVSVSHLSVGEASHFLILPSNVPPVTLWVPPPPLLYPQSAGASISSSPSQMATGGVPHSCLPLRWPLGPPHGPLPLVGSPSYPSFPLSPLLYSPRKGRPRRKVSAIPLVFGVGIAKSPVLSRL